MILLRLIFFKKNNRSSRQQLCRKCRSYGKLKYLSNIWRTLELPLVNCEINLMLTYSASCVITSDPAANRAKTFEINYSKLVQTQNQY